MALQHLIYVILLLILTFTIKVLTQQKTVILYENVINFLYNILYSGHGLVTLIISTLWTSYIYPCEGKSKGQPILYPRMVNKPRSKMYCLMFICKQTMLLFSMCKYFKLYTTFIALNIYGQAHLFAYYNVNMSYNL